MRCTCGEAERFTASQPFLLSAPVRPHGQTYHFETVASRRGPWWRFTAGPGDRVTLRRVGCRLPISGVSAEVFRLAQLTGWLWWPVMSSHAPSRHSRVFPPQQGLVVTRFRPAAALAITTTADCTGIIAVYRKNRQAYHFQCNPSCVPAFHRGGAGESDPPLASFAITSTTLSFQLPAGH